MVHGNHPSIAKMRDYADFRATSFLGTIINTILERQKKERKYCQSFRNLNPFSLFPCHLIRATLPLECTAQWTNPRREPSYFEVEPFAIHCTLVRGQICSKIASKSWFGFYNFSGLISNFCRFIFTIVSFSLLILVKEFNKIYLTEKFLVCG